MSTQRFLTLAVCTLLTSSIAFLGGNSTQLTMAAPTESDSTQPTIQLAQLHYQSQGLPRRRVGGGTR
jgi:hypothetical protein